MMFKLYLLVSRIEIPSLPQARISLTGLSEEAISTVVCDWELSGINETNQKYGTKNPH